MLASTVHIRTHVHVHVRPLRVAWDYASLAGDHTPEPFTRYPNSFIPVTIPTQLNCSGK